jgi:hypothetical protein
MSSLIGDSALTRRSRAGNRRLTNHYGYTIIPG